MKNLIKLPSIFVLITAVILSIGYSFKSSEPTVPLCDNSTAGVELKTGMRRLWYDHIAWTRNVVLNIMDGLPGTDQAVKRLLKNQDDIGNAIVPYYGDEAGKKLASLLHDHINIAAEVLKAAKADNKPTLDDANKRWFKNADDISAFLAKANSKNWTEDGLKKMMHKHLELLTDETMARKKKDYDADVKAFDNSVDEIMEMADMLSMGIVQQFPDKFKSTNTTSGTK